MGLAVITDAMKPGFEKAFSRAKAPLSAALVLLLLVLQTFAVSTRLHNDVHADATSTDHECAVTLLSKAQLDVSEPLLDLPLPPVFAPLRMVCSGPVVTPALLHLPDSRGPPVPA